MVRLAIVFLAILLPAHAGAAPRLRVSLPPGLACPSSDDLLRSLSRRFGTDRIASDQPTGDELGLSLTTLEDALELDLVSNRGEPPYRRRLPLHAGSCADLAETIGLLVDAWVRDLPWHGAGFLRDVPETARPGAPVIAQAHPAEESLLPQPRQAHVLALRLGAGASVGSDANLAAEGALSADLGLFGGFGAAVLVSVRENARAVDKLPSGAAASLGASRQVLVLMARYAFVADDMSGPRVFAGIALQTFEARSSGFTVDSSNFEVVPAGFAAGLWQQRILGRLSAYLQLSAALGPKVDFDVSQAGGTRPVLSLAPAWFDASLGLAWRFF